MNLVVLQDFHISRNQTTAVLLYCLERKQYGAGILKDSHRKQLVGRRGLPTIDDTSVSEVYFCDGLKDAAASYRRLIDGQD